MTDRGELYREAVRALRHDARNLLNGIGIMAEHFEATDDAKGKQFTSYLQDKVGAMVRLGERADLIGNLGEPLPEKTDLASLVSKTIGRLGPDQPVDVDLGKATAVCDARLTMMALQEILGNAIATGAKVTVRMEEKDGTRALVVADRGPGIPDPALPNLFTPYRGAKRPGGSSLGLPIARLAMRAQGGDVTLVSVLGEGTTVRIVLPKD